VRTRFVCMETSEPKETSEPLTLFPLNVFNPRGIVCITGRAVQAERSSTSRTHSHIGVRHQRHSSSKSVFTPLRQGIQSRQQSGVHACILDLVRNAAKVVPHDCGNNHSHCILPLIFCQKQAMVPALHILKKTSTSSAR
jgi:hypothetical protein